MLVTLGASGCAEISSAVGWNDCCPQAAGGLAGGVKVTTRAGKWWSHSSRGFDALTVDGGSALSSCAVPSKSAKLGGARHALTALVQSLPI